MAKSSRKTNIPTIEIGPRGPREGQTLRIPEDFTPVPDIQLDMLEREARVQLLLREEEERARDAGMTVDELRHYQDLLQKRFF